MTRPYLDGALIRRLCSEHGMSLRQLAASLSCSLTRINGLLSGRGDENVTLEELDRIAQRLGVAPLTLLLTPDGEQREASTDDVQLEATLATAGETLTRAEVADALGWTLPRVHRAVAALDARLAGTGLRLHRSTKTTLRLASRHEALTDEQRRRASRATVHRRGLNIASAKLLLGIALDDLPLRSKTAQTVERQALVKQALIEEELGGALRLHPDVAFSLGLED